MGKHAGLSLAGSERRHWLTMRSARARDNASNKADAGARQTLPNVGEQHNVSASKACRVKPSDRHNIASAAVSGAGKKREIRDSGSADRLAK